MSVGRCLTPGSREIVDSRAAPPGGVDGGHRSSAGPQIVPPYGWGLSSLDPDPCPDGLGRDHAPLAGQDLDCRPLGVLVVNAGSAWHIWRACWRVCAKPSPAAASPDGRQQEFSRNLEKLNFSEQL